MKGTIKQLSDVKTIVMDSGPLKTQQLPSLILLAGSITVVFWSDWVKSVENGKSYIFTNLRIKKNNYTNKLYVNTAKVGINPI